MDRAGNTYAIVVDDGATQTAIGSRYDQPRPLLELGGERVPVAWRVRAATEAAYVLSCQTKIGGYSRVSLLVFSGEVELK